jgi:Flp pilus assembly protein TadD
VAALTGLGRALDGEKAVDAFRLATRSDPADALSWQELGQALMKLGQNAEALAAFRKSIELDAGVPEAHYALATYWAGPGEDAGRAESSFREAIRLQPDYAQARMNLAILLSRAARGAEAAFHFEYALRVRPDYPLAHLNYGLMLRAAGRPAEATRQFTLAAEGSDAGIRVAAAKALAEMR